MRCLRCRVALSANQIRHKCNPDVLGYHGCPVCHRSFPLLGGLQDFAGWSRPTPPVLPLGSLALHMPLFFWFFRGRVRASKMPSCLPRRRVTTSKNKTRLVYPLRPLADGAMHIASGLLIRRLLRCITPYLPTKLLCARRYPQEGLWPSWREKAV
jgi:hypothetical protein